MTTYPKSTVKAAKAWLFGQLNAGLTPDPASPTLELSVTYDEPGTLRPEDLVSVGDITRTVVVNALVGTEGAWAFQETYLLEVVVSVYRGGDNAVQAFERACDLVDAIITIQRTDPTMGGALIQSRVQTIDQPGAAWDSEDHKGRVAKQKITVYCQGVY